MNTAPSLPPIGGAAPRVLQRAARLVEAARELSGLLDPSMLASMEAGAVAAMAVELHGAAEQVRAAASAGIARVADSGWPQQQEYVNARAWWQDVTKLSKDEAGAQVRLARRLVRHYPRTATAWESGLLADPDGASEAAMRREGQANLTIDQVGDLTVLSAQLPVQVAEKLRVILDHYRMLAVRCGVGEAAPDGPRREVGPAQECEAVDPVTGDPVIVSDSQKDAAALADWIDSTLDAGLGSKPVGERPHLDVVVTLEDLLEGRGAALLSRTNTPVPATTAARTACDGQVRVVIVDGVYRDARSGAELDPVIGGLLLGAAGLLDYGRAHRIVPTRLRRALAHRDRGCAFPGCVRTPAHTEAHHILPWEHGGPTSLANTVLLCRRHHHAVHDGGWRVSLRARLAPHLSGCWQFHAPDRPARLRGGALRRLGSP